MGRSTVTRQTDQEPRTVASRESAKSAARMICRDHNAVPAALLERAAALKAQSVGAANILWGCLQDRQLHGFEFTAKRDLGPFIADFYCEAAQLIIKLGDDQTRRERAPLCDKWARANGFRVVRVHLAEVERNIEQVLNVMTLVLRAATR